MLISEKQKQIVEEFSRYDRWEDRYKHIIEIGKTLKPLDEKLKTEDNRIKGCQSITYLYAKLDGDKILYTADSDAMIVKGLATLLIQVYSDHTPKEILETSADFLTEMGLTTHLSQSRSNGLAAMVRQFKNYAIAFQTLLGK